LPDPVLSIVWHPRELIIFFGTAGGIFGMHNFSQNATSLVQENTHPVLKVLVRPQPNNQPTLFITVSYDAIVRLYQE
jgi:hypothetical protein